MKLRTELLLYTLTLALLNVLLAFGAIGLFLRMGPAIGRILEENVVSIDAAELILAEFAATPGELDAGARQRAARALRRASENVTEPEEEPVLQAIQAQLEAAFAGEPEARASVIARTRELIAINRQAMRDVDREAQRLGAAGAWAAVILGALSFAAALLVIVQLRRRLVDPVLEIHAVLAAARAGDRFRRCRSAGAPTELQQAAEAVNRLLDERTRP